MYATCKWVIWICATSMCLGGCICIINALAKSWDYSGVLGTREYHRAVFSHVLRNITWVSALSLPSAFHQDACHQVLLSSDLNHLVAEIRALRGQLEQSIQMNNCLRLQLEQQLDAGAVKPTCSPSSISQNFSVGDPGKKQLPFQGKERRDIKAASGEALRCS